MISIEDAIQFALQAVKPLGSVKIPLTNSLNRILFDDLTSDIDMPPFNKSAMDGYAFHAADVQSSPCQLKVVGVVQAGGIPNFTVKRGEAAKIMTGAPLPHGCDAVQMVEKTRSIEPSIVEILEKVEPGKHVAFKGEVMQKDSVVLRRGAFVNPAVVGVLASIGQEMVSVCRLPDVAVLATGDELVDVGQQPGPGQIRNSNGYAISAQLKMIGVTPKMMGCVTDDLASLRSALMAGLEQDVLLISGGVSMGDYDFVEKVLAELGVDIIYDSVNIKPGKPAVMGTTGSCAVFGLPGNPVSASTVFDILVTPVFKKIMGYPRFESSLISAKLRGDFINKNKRVSYHPAVVMIEAGEFVAQPLSSKGSADVLAYSQANSYLIGTPQSAFGDGDEIPVALGCGSSLFI